MKTPADEIPSGSGATSSTCPCEQPELPSIECVDRVKKLPIVEAAWNQSATMYNNVKGYNQLLNWALGTAEGTVNKAYEQTLPVVAPIVKRLEAPIGMVDKTLCKGLDAVENAVPCIKQEPAQIAENAKLLCEPAYQQVKSLQELSMLTANQLLKTKVGAALVGGVDQFTATTDKILDFLLPPGEPLGLPRAEKVTQALVTIGGLPQKAARFGYDTICNILQSTNQQDLRQNLKAIVNLLQLHNFAATLSESASSTPPSTSPAGTQEQNTSPKAEASKPSS